MNCRKGSGVLTTRHLEDLLVLRFGGQRKNAIKKEGFSLLSDCLYVIDLELCCRLLVKKESGTYRMCSASDNRIILSAAELQSVVIESFREKRDAINCLVTICVTLQLISRPSGNPSTFICT